MNFSKIENGKINNINFCFFSSFIFLFNVVICLFYNYYTYSLLFFLLFITSIIVHTNTNIYTLIIDKFAIFFIVFYGGYLFYKKFIDINNIEKLFHGIVIIITFLLTIYLYFYGYICKAYCFNTNPVFAKLWHSLLHLISSFGHWLIVTL